MKTIALLAASFGLAAALSAPATAASIPGITAIAATAAPSDIVTVSGGCGPYAWRGPWGHCRDTPYTGPLPGGGWAGAPERAADFFGNGCPPGYWHGPWGHCRNTAYHGRLPGGGWK
ncbi:GCG_CRPN prefix-to-repeats domain-containing protein [Bosea sp. BH3]|uniref:GCG_CRPN prefix-to-repeats domain-containing protein n=1 Tax=Bosea sp. BH3 TaxID=2871701 RepID=UPI003966C02B